MHLVDALVDPDAHDSARRRQGSLNWPVQGRRAGLCDAQHRQLDCAGHCLPTAIPRVIRKVHLRHLSGQYETGGNWRGASQLETASSGPVVAFRRPGRQLGGRRSQPGTGRVPATAHGSHGPCVGQTPGPQVISREPGTLFTEDRGPSKSRSKRFGEPLAPARFRPPYVRNHCYAGAHSGTT